MLPSHDVTPAKIMRAINGSILRLFRYLAMGLICLMTLVILTQIFSRFLWDHALAWPEEIAKWMMVWVAFLIAPVAYSNNLNVNMNMLIDRLHPRIRQSLELFIHSLTTMAAIVLLIEGWKMMMRGQWIQASTVEIKLHAIYAIMPISFAMIASVGIEKIGNLLFENSIKEFSKS